MNIEHTFSHHPPTPEKIAAHEMLRSAAKDFAYIIDYLPAGREKSLAMTKLQETLMWANAAVAMLDDAAF